MSEPRECQTCAWGDGRTRMVGVGVPTGTSGIGGELKVPYDYVWCHRHDEEMSLGDTCAHWKSNHDDEDGGR